jgi:tetratricopeptide (TPR) repeat protein
MRPSANSSADVLAADELDSLLSHVSLHLANAERQLGLCYPPRSADRDDLLLQAVKRLTPLAQQSTADELTWRARAALLACQRELGQLQAAHLSHDAWSQQGPPRVVAAELAAERVRLLIAEGRSHEAAQFAEQTQLQTGDASGELALARLEAALADWRRSRAANPSVDARPLVGQIDAIRRRHGPYWARRGERLIGGALASASGPIDDAASLLLAAEHLYASGQIDQSLAGYERAIGLLRQQDQAERAFAAGMTAAAIERQAGRFAAASDRYQRMADEQPNHARAAEAHLLAIVSTADLIRVAGDTDSNSPAAKRYEQLLASHLARWPHDPTAADARQWLASLLSARGDVAAAVAVLAETPPTSPNYAAAVRGIAERYEMQMDQLHNRPDEVSSHRRAELLSAATRFLQPVITGADNRWPATWTALQRETALTLARLHLRYADDRADYSERLLAQALAGVPADVDADSAQYVRWRREALGAQIAALARGGKAAQARTLTPQLAGSPNDLLLGSLAGVVDAIAGLPAGSPDAVRETGQIALELVRLVDAQRGGLSEPDRQKLDRHKAAALAATGDRAAALAVYRDLAAELPDDGDLGERYAAVLADSQSPADWQDALARWQIVEQRSRPGSSRWQRARRARIDLLNRLGEREEAEKLLRLTRLLYPDWDHGNEPP